MRTISLMRGPFQVCDACYAMVLAEKLVDERNVAADHEAIFDHICPNCFDRNRPLIDDMLGSSE
jgi:hypothetical protein